ncbi:hypothetical protein SLS59_008556 [Nothophoma quercina]|uniref:Uncharacterized protein n=1 Tax=Nothophoma quercina TaxID=749835 RepID=A0ABR3QS94_9PLEO
MQLIKSHYKDDVRVEMKQNYILFKAGEHPSLPFEGHKLLRFSAKVLGSIAADSRVESYIDAVTRIAKGQFGYRIRYWHEGIDGYGHYNWDEVNGSIQSYEQRDEPEVRTGIASSLINEIDPMKELGIPLFNIKRIPGKGRGLIARSNLSKGTRILCEKPLLTAVSMPRGKLESILAIQLRALPKVSQRQFLSLHNKSPGK